MKIWDELSTEEQEVARRLPASADYPAVDRQRTHQWCTRCWFEATGEDSERLT